MILRLICMYSNKFEGLKPMKMNRIRKYARKRMITIEATVIVILKYTKEAKEIQIRCTN